MLPFVCESSAGFAGVSSVVVAEILLRLLQQCSETLLKERERDKHTRTEYCSQLGAFNSCF